VRRRTGLSIRRLSPWTVFDRSRVGLLGDPVVSADRRTGERRASCAISCAGVGALRRVAGADMRFGITSFSVSTSVVSGSKRSSSVRAGVVGVDENASWTKDVGYEEGVADDAQYSTFCPRSDKEELVLDI
jgi:hypothetical protein